MSEAKPELNDVPIGLEHTVAREVALEDCITFLGDDVPPSLATPRMILWMEHCCRSCIEPKLPEGHDSVGVRVEVDHLGATANGGTVTYTAKVVTIDGLKVRFEVEAKHADHVVGRGFHERFVVDVARFKKRLKKQLGG